MPFYDDYGANKDMLTNGFVQATLSQNGNFKDPNRHVNLSKKISKKPDLPYFRPAATSTVKLISYITVKAIELDVSYVLSLWPLFVLKELLDNAWDFLNDYYSQCPKEDRRIVVTINVQRKAAGPIQKGNTPKYSGSKLQCQ